MPKLLSRQFAKDLPEITTSNYFEKKKRYHKDGLFSEHIFGLSNNYTCRCGIYHGKHSEGQISKCNGKFCTDLLITNSIKRRRQYAKITLPIPLINRTYISHLKRTLPSIEKDLYNDITKLMKSYRTILVKYEDEFILKTLGDDENFNDIKYEYWQMHEAVEKLVRYVIEVYLTIDPDNKDFKLLLDQLEEHLFLYEVIVIPPSMRPISQINPTTNSVDQLNQYYYQLLVKKEIMAAGDIDVTRHMKIYQQYYLQFQKTVDELFDYIIGNISKKEGLIRGNILGKRIDFSGRAVIAPSPTIELNECILPYRMVLEFYKIPIAKKLIEKGHFSFLHNALEKVELCQFHNDPELIELCREIIGDDVCLLNRQPSLHKLGLIAFNIKVEPVDVIYIHPMVCRGFNADFDGDCVWSKCRLRRLEHPDYIGEIADLKDSSLFKHIPEKEKENISHYEPTEELTIKAISLDDGTIAEKKVLDYSEHRNLKMFSINDPQNRFERFWVSDDHSVIVWDENEQKNLKISPEELLEKPEGRYLVQQKY